MRRFAKISLSAAGLAGFAVMTVSVLPDAVKAADGTNTLTFDVACDCRTGAGGPNRGDPFIINGKIFPAGTLPSGTASNDPTLPVNGVAPIGNWICRGQNSLPFPNIIAPAYSTSPFAFFDWYFILNDGRGLTAAGYPISEAGAAKDMSTLSVTGGIGSFSGASGDIQAASFGTNATGCPNFRTTFRFQPGSVRGVSH
jgi:hypothetical protein